MIKRFFSGAAITFFVAFLLLLSDYIVYSIGFSALAVIATFELLRVIGVHKKPLIVIPAYLFATAFPITAFFVNNDNNTRLMFILALAAAIYVYMMWLMGISVFSKGRIAFSKIAEVILVVTYVSVSFTSLVLLRYINSTYGALCFVLAFLIPWVCDVFAYFVGSKLGKHKLIPEVSPKKTVEGAIGGVIFSEIFCLLYGLGVDYFGKNIEVNYIVLALFGVILPIVSQLGDLIASLIKREYGVKDYGRILPGHGGIMDRFDSVLAISTILLILCMVVSPFSVA
jgi:phosphatidate cytidylyltransferase